MFNTLIKHYIYDIAIGVMFDSMYKNIVVTQLQPIITGRTIELKGGFFTILIHNVGDDIVDKYGSFTLFAFAMMNEIMKLPINKVPIVIKELYGLEAELVITNKKYVS